MPELSVLLIGGAITLVVLGVGWTAGVRMMTGRKKSED